MKALTNILTHMLLMLLLLMLVACAEETAEVDNLSRGEQYVTVRMNIPGMTAAATRADDGVIETIHALAFNADKELLATRTATNINNANENDGFNGTFNLTVPNGTETIHFLANVGDYDFSSVKQESDLSNLSIGDWNMLRYWGKASYDGNNSTISTTLYRNLAKISIMPSVTDPEFNQFTQDQLSMTGFYNANERGALVPCKDGQFNFDDNSEYCTMPQDLTSANYQLYSFTTMTAFEHENTDANPTYIICKIGDYHYKVALADDEGNRYPIIRNHHYIIYVSDVDDYSHDDNYRADTYEKAFDKLPINLEVEVIELLDVTFSPTEQQTVQMDNTLSISMTVPTDRTLTNFSIKADGFTFDTPNDSYEAGTTTFTFTPTSVGNKTITFTGQGENLNTVNTTINVNVTASINANADKQQLYYDSDDPQTVKVNVTIPTGVETLNISAADFAFNGEDDGEYTYAVNGQTNATLSFTLESGISEAKTSTITFSDAGGNATEAPVSVKLVATPTVTFSPDETSKTMNVNDTYNVAMNANGGTLTALNIAAEGFTVTSSSGGLSGPTNNVYTYTGGTTTFTFTPTSAGDYTIRFYDGQGVDINVPETSIIVIVTKPTITATANTTTLYYDTDNQTTTVTVNIPKGVSALNITATDFTVALQSGNGNLNGNTYTPNDTNGQTAVFVFTMNNVSSTSGQTSTAIEFSDNGGVATSPSPITITLEKEPESVSSLVVTPVGSTTIDLGEGGNKTVKFSISIPSDLAYLSIFTNYAFTVSALNGYTQPRAQAPYYYYDYIQPGSVKTIDLEFAIDSDLIFETEGDYPITFYTMQNSSEGVTTTISVINEDLDDGVIWEGSKTAIAAGHRLKYTSFSEYRDSGKQLKIDVTPTGDGWKQFYIKYEGDNNNNLTSFTGNNLDSTLSIDIPTEDKNLIISGEGGITITKIYVE